MFSSDNRGLVGRVGVNRPNLLRPRGGESLPPSTEAELLFRARSLRDETVGAVAAALELRLPSEARRAKGFVGSLVEKVLGACPEAKDNPDFPELGVELKTIPVDGAGRPKETTFVCAVTMAEAATAHWEESRLRRKLSAVLFVPVDCSAPDLAERCFGAPRLWRPSDQEWALLRADWEDLMGAVGAGLVPSARQGVCVQLRPKAAHGRVRTLGPECEPVLPLGFYLRRQCTTDLLAPAAPRR